ncbi:DUF1294 domain-containing protein [Neobacillus jeddahensis]|uniref:DUF1294 domain-containing protein n=1 Tax=Neobacillus jeddahensis TaxID=1461580 RepID=UPI00058F1DB8|nr:DUF1294 domain-containing protein [Neobacillus jeddahensis]
MMIGLVAFFAMNVVGILIMGEDKRRAKRHEYRIRERTLWLVALFGGAIGTTVGMQVYRHKTKHTSFKLGFPILAILEFAIFIKIIL